MRTRAWTTTFHPARTPGETRVTLGVGALKKGEDNMSEWFERLLKSWRRDKFFNSVRFRDIEQVRSLLQRYPEFAGAMHAEGATALHCAVVEGKKPIVMLLIEWGADVDAKAKGDSPWAHEVPLEQRGVDLAKTILPGVQQLARRMFLQGDEWRSFARRLQQQAEHGPSQFPCYAEEPACVPYDPGWDGTTPLHWAAIRGRQEEVEVLLTNGASIEADDCLGQTPLIKAVVQNHRDIVDFLVRRGADVNTSDRFGRIALRIACELEYKELAAFLVNNGSDVNATDQNGLTALHWVSPGGDTDAARLLLKAGADVNLGDKGGRTALHLAQMCDNSDTFVRLLRANGADAGTTDCCGYTPDDYLRAGRRKREEER